MGSARIVAPIMAAQGGGAIVNISTFAAFEPASVAMVEAAESRGLEALLLGLLAALLAG